MLRTWILSYPVAGPWARFGSDCAGTPRRSENSGLRRVDPLRLVASNVSGEFGPYLEDDQTIYNLSYHNFVGCINYVYLFTTF